MVSIKKIVFITGTRADFGKLKPLINVVETSEKFECYVFVTGMHTLSKYGKTVIEVRKQNYRNIYEHINQSDGTDMDTVLSNTILGFSNYIKELKPDLIIVHGDRIEALAAAIVGSINNILVGHVEGGEISGTIDELIRHATSKMSHIHFVSNERAKNRLIQMGENELNIFAIGSPDIDIMLSNELPSIAEIKRYYEIPFDKYSIFCYHPVTTELDSLEKDIKNAIEALIKSNKKYVVIYPNNDPGSDIILHEIKKLSNNDNFRVLPSMRFEYFLSLLKNCEFIIGNSSSGIMEAGVFGKPSINIGTRQMNRSKKKSIINVNANSEEIINAIEHLKDVSYEVECEFGSGNSTKKFYEIISKESFWQTSNQKQFIDHL